jgi:hypothetical protein
LLKTKITFEHNPNPTFARYRVKKIGNKYRLLVFFLTEEKKEIKNEDGSLFHYRWETKDTSMVTSETITRWLLSVTGKIILNKKYKNSYFLDFN